MKKKIILMLFIGFSSISTSAQSSVDFRQAIQQNFQEMGEAMANSNPELLATYFTEDALLKISGKAALKGREAIAKLHEMMLEKGIFVKPNTTEVESFGDTGYEMGTYQMLDQERNEVDSGIYATIWKKIDGEWKIYRDVISSNPKD